MHAIAGSFYGRASVTPKRVLRSIRTQKVLATVGVLMQERLVTDFRQGVLKKICL